jgi:hypothetical protein
MWCKTCQQDVPGLVSGHTGNYSCPRCGSELREGPATGRSRSDDAPDEVALGSDTVVFEPVAPEPPPTYDGWDLDQQFRHVERLLRIDRANRSSTEDAPRKRRIRLHGAHDSPSGWHDADALKAKTARRRAARRAGAVWLAMLTWSVLALGLTASAFAGALLTWSALSGRQELWTLGMPVGLVGQIVLVIGLILQLDRLWHDNRDTAEKLDHVGARLHDLNESTTLLGTSYGAASSPFYSHMAGGASSQVLLADLKSQLDLLAVKLSRENE